MKVKKYWEEYADWKTKAQWEKLGKVVIDETKGVDMYPTQSHCIWQQWYKYFGPENVRDKE